MSSRTPHDLRTRITRRRLLAGVSSTAALLTAPIWRADTAFGQDAKQPAPVRFIGMFSANGTIPAEFFPSTKSSDSLLTLKKILQPLAQHTQQLLVLKGVHMYSTVQDELGVMSANKPGGPHMKGPGAMLTGGSLMAGSFTGAGGPAGYADRISVDQLIANRIGGSSKFPSLEFGVRIEGQEPLRVISYRGANQPNTAVDDPQLMYSRIFADANLSSAELARVLAEKKSVLDFLQADLTRLQGRVSAPDKARLDAHLTGIRSLEQRLSLAAPSCKAPDQPTTLDALAMENYPTVGRLQTDLMLLAHRCGLTRVSTLMWANADSWQYYPWIGVNEEHHALSHSSDDDSAATDKLIKINTWHAEQVGYALDQLAATQDSDGKTMLDNTVLLWGNELGIGNVHSYTDIPWLLAGGAGGYFKMGRFLQLKDQPHNNLLLSICHALGLTDLTSFGIPALCTGPLSGLTG